MSGVILLSQLDLNGNPVTLPSEQGSVLPSSGRLALMAAKGADLRLLLVILIAMELPFSGLLTAAGC